MRAFRYADFGTPVHLLDSRVKLVAVLVLSAVSLSVSYEGAVVVTLFLVSVSYVADVSLVSVASEVKPFLFLLVFVLVARSVLTPGETLVSLGPVDVTRQGVSVGVLVVWRLSLVTAFAAVLVRTTSPSRVADTASYFLSPLPVNQADVATMMSLTVRFIPLILDESDEVKDAAKARCVGERGRVRRTVAYSYPLLLRVLRRADELAVAMSSRCYTGARRAEFSTGRRDALALAVVASVALVSLGVTFL